jgi:hypothetical protein
MQTSPGRGNFRSGLARNHKQRGTSEKRDDETIDLPVLSPAITDVRRTAKSRRAIANALRSQAPRSLSIRSFTSEGDLSHALYNQGTARLIPHL